MVDEDDWDEVNQVLDADIEFEDPETQMLYDETARYARRAEVLEDHGDDDKAEYFRELAVDAYESLVPVMQMKKSAEEYGLEAYDSDEEV